MVRVLTWIGTGLPPCLAVVALVSMSEPVRWSGVLAGDASDRLEKRVTRVVESDPQVLVIGNSTANTDIEVSLVKQALGARTIGALSEPNSGAPLWSVLLEDHVFGQGARPKQVVVASNVAALLAPLPQTEAERSALAAYSRSPALERRLFGERPEERRWSRFRSRAYALRTTLVETPRNALVGLAWGHLGAPWVAGAQVLAEAFGEGAAGQDELVLPDALAAPEESFVPDIVRSAASHGAEVVFVLLPTRDAPGDVAVVAAERALAVWANTNHVEVVDRRSGAGITRADFVDPLHMTANGRTKLSEAIARDLARFAAEGFAPGPLPRPSPEFVRRGTWGPVELQPPGVQIGECTWLMGDDRRLPLPLVTRPATTVPTLPLRVTMGEWVAPRAPPDGPACIGGWSPGPAGTLRLELPPYALPAPLAVSVDPGAVSTSDPRSAWVFPGTSFDARFPPGWRDEDVVVEVDALRLDATDDPPRLTVAEGPAAPGLPRVAALGLRGSGPPRELVGDVALDGDVWRGRVVVPASEVDDGFEVRWSSPAGGPWMRIRSVRARIDEEERVLLGEPTAGATLDLFRDPPTVQGAEGPLVLRTGPFLVGSEQDLAVARLWEAFPDRSAFTGTMGRSACIPGSVVDLAGEEHRFVVRDGLVVAWPTAGLAGGATAVLNEDRRCHWWAFDGDRERRLLFGGIRASEFRGLAIRREAHHSVWAYPGDRLRFRIRNDADLEATLGALAFEARAVGGDPHLTLDLVVDGVQRQWWAVPATDLDGSEVRSYLDDPLWGDVRQVDVVMTTAGPGLLFVESARLIEAPERPVETWMPAEVAGSTGPVSVSPPARPGRARR